MANYSRGKPDRRTKSRGRSRSIRMSKPPWSCARGLEFRPGGFSNEGGSQRPPEYHARSAGYKRNPIQRRRFYPKRGRPSDHQLGFRRTENIYILSLSSGLSPAGDHGRLWLEVNPEGAVAAVSILKSMGKEMDIASMKAFVRWRAVPGPAPYRGRWPADCANRASCFSLVDEGRSTLLLSVPPSHFVIVLVLSA